MPIPAEPAEHRHGVIRAGARDVRRAAQAVASNIPSRLAPLSRVAYNYSWSWQPDGDELFRDIDGYRWRLCGHNPVRFLGEVPEDSLERAAGTRRFVERAEVLRDALESTLTRAPGDWGVPVERPVAFFCSEFGVHRSLPIYPSIRSMSAAP